jgi:hypothetical protein
MTDTPGAPAIPAPPANATEASVRLGALSADKEWAGKLLAGDVAANREFQELSALVATGDKVDAAIAGIRPDIQDGVIPDSSTVLMTNVAADLRANGISDDSIRQVLTGQKVSKQERTLVETWKGQRMRDPAWTKLYLAGDPQAVRDMTLANIVISSEVAEARAA